MVTLLMIMLVIVSILLMGIVLIQSSKGSGLAGSIGGGDASMVFGVRRTADFLVKATTVLATIFLLFSLVTNIIINKGTGSQESIIQQGGDQQQLPGPNVPNNQQPPNQQQQNNVQQPNQQQQDPTKPQIEIETAPVDDKKQEPKKEEKKDTKKPQ